MNILYIYKVDCREKFVIIELCLGFLFGVVGLLNYIVYSLCKVVLYY